MNANGTQFGCLLADDDVAAVRALPDNVSVARENDVAFDVVQQLAVAFFVMLFDGSYQLKLRSNFVEAFFASSKLWSSAVVEVISKL